MAIRTNPFHELYVGESIGPDKFVLLFSNVIVDHSLALFQPGNVILKGLPGTGKTMLLNLLKPSIRIAYANSTYNFPVPPEFRKFIGAGINLKRSGVSDFGQRNIEDVNDSNISAVYFGDFLNYWVVSDILLSIHKFCNEDQSGSLVKEIGINYQTDLLDQFAASLSTLDCWSNYLIGVNKYSELKEKINKRISDYRAFLNYNSNELSKEIKESKTIVGIPISKCVELLRTFGIIEKDVEVFIRIDQFEELAWLDTTNLDLGNTYQQVIHKLLGMRDSNVSYRIGARHFAWSKNHKKMFGSDAQLEKKRHYNEISIDTVLRRKENARVWIFPKFAEDIFNRRIFQSPYRYDDVKEQLMSHVFGKGYSPDERAKRYVPNDKAKALKLEDNWPLAFQEFLLELVEKSPLSAKLAEAWARQKGKELIVNNVDEARTFPWEKKKWWKKERIEQALMQIASRNQQQLIWYGKDDVLGLSGGNILAFLSLCQHIWDVYLRDKRNIEVDSDNKLPQIDYVIQSLGIKEASDDWFDDISNEKGGKERKLFITFLGRHFNKTLSDDKAMSYPGRNGFSLTIEDFEKSKLVNEFLKDATDYGDLQDANHTTKSNDKKPRYKWYLNPILSPHFKIPYAHTKEPLYLTLKDFKIWLIQSEAYSEEEVDLEKDEISKRKARINKIDQQGAIEFPQN